MENINLRLEHQPNTEFTILLPAKRITHQSKIHVNLHTFKFISTLMLKKKKKNLIVRVIWKFLNNDIISFMRILSFYENVQLK